MIRRASLVGLILGIPLIGFAVAEGIQNYYNSELRETLKKQFPDADPTAIANASFTRLCRESTTELQEICATNQNLDLISAVAVWAASVGILLLVGIRFAGSLARNNRRVLLWVFKPGLFFTALLLIILVPVHAVLAMARCTMRNLLSSVGSLYSLSQRLASALLPASLQSRATFSHWYVTRELL